MRQYLIANFLLYLNKLISLLLLKKIFIVSKKLIALLVISNILDKLQCKQLTTLMEQLLSKFQCVFRKGNSAQYCLLVMLKKWENTVDNRKLFGAILRDLSKSFYYNSHELVIVNLNWYEINWYERTEINILCSSWEEILS